MVHASLPLPPGLHGGEREPRGERGEGERRHAGAAAHAAVPAAVASALLAHH